MVISRFMRRATSVKRSIWKPSMPPPSLGIACGAKVPSTPVRSGGSFSWARAGAAQRSAVAAMAARRRRIMVSLLGPRDRRACGTPVAEGGRARIGESSSRRSCQRGGDKSTELPDERYQTITDSPLVFGIARQIRGQHALLVEESPDQERRHGGDRHQSPVGAEGQRRGRQV